MPKRKRKTNKGKTYTKPVTLYPLTDEQALIGLLKTPPIKQKPKKKK
jgi:hypothetical protein